MSFNTSIFKKALMAFTGLSLALFTIVHLIGNLQLFYNDGGDAFNVYAHFMSTNPIIQASAWGLKAVIVLHIIYAIFITLANRKARPIKYANEKNNSSWMSRNMGLLGTVLLVFIVVHLANFWAKYHYASGIPTIEIDGETYKNLYLMVQETFANPLLVGLYVVSMLSLALHLIHGFNSGFQTFGINHPKVNSVIKFTGLGISILIPLGFAMIPIYMYINSL